MHLPEKLTLSDLVLRSFSKIIAISARGLWTNMQQQQKCLRRSNFERVDRRRPPSDWRDSQVERNSCISKRCRWHGHWTSKKTMAGSKQMIADRQQLPLLFNEKWNSVGVQ